MNELKTKQYKLFIYIFIFSIGALLTFILIDYILFTKETKKTLLQEAIVVSKEKEKILQKEIIATDKLLYSIEESNSFKDYLINKNQKQIEDLFLSIAKHDNNILQLRYISKDGQEKVRIEKGLSNNYNSIEKKYLQDKSKRYYFKESLNKKKLWHSKIDLNVEHEKIQIPYTPTLRTILPIYTNNKFNGIIVINYEIKTILNNILTSHKYNISLLNEKGIPLSHYNNTNSLFLDEVLNTIFTKQLKNQELHIETNFSNNDYIIKKINLSIPQNLYLLLKINEKYKKKIFEYKFYYYFLISLVFIVLSLIMSFLFEKYLKISFEIIKDEKTLNEMLQNKINSKTKSLERSRKRLHDIIVSIQDYIWEINERGEYKYLSPQFEKITGYDIEDFIFKKNIYSSLSDSEKKRLKPLMDNYFTTHKKIDELLVKKIHKNGSTIFIEITGNPIFDDDNKFIGFRGTSRNVTKKIQLEKKLIESHKRLEEINSTLENKIKKEIKKNQEKDLQLFKQSKMASMGDMITNIAHQWRQPLSAITTIASGVKLLQEYNKELTAKELSDSMDNILIKANFLSSTIDTFMGFVKDKKEFTYESIKKIINKSIFMVNSSIENNFIKIDTNLDEFNDFKIKTIPNELIEVIINILSNAKDALKTKDSNRKIKIEILNQKESVQIKISDNAGGIPENIIDRIYEPYFTTKSKENGTGIGLNISYRIITESLKGQIFVKNINDGAQFTLILPNRKD